MSFAIDFLVKGVWKKINLIEGIDNIDVKTLSKSYKIAMVLNTKQAFNSAKKLMIVPARDF